jgi:hypothetical protein
MRPGWKGRMRPFQETAHARFPQTVHAPSGRVAHAPLGGAAHARPQTSPHAARSSHQPHPNVLAGALASSRAPTGLPVRNAWNGTDAPAATSGSTARPAATILLARRAIT